MSIKRSRDELFTSGKGNTSVYMLFKHDVQGNFFDSNWIEIGVEALEMHWEDDKL